MILEKAFWIKKSFYIAHEIQESHAKITTYSIVQLFLSLNRQILFPFCAVYFQIDKYFVSL